MEIGLLLQNEFNQRRQKNKRYSLRSFATALEIDATALSRIMKRDRIPSPLTADHLLKKMGLSDNLRINTLKDLQFLVSEKRRPKQFAAMSEKNFEEIFNRKYVLILEALQMRGNTLEKIREKVCSSLKIDNREFDRIIKELKDVGALQDSSTGVDVLQKNTSTVPLPLTSQKRKELQKQFLGMAQEAIEDFDLTYRDNATLTVPLHQDDIEEVKKILAQARRRINSLALKRKAHTHVYNISTALYPVIK